MKPPALKEMLQKECHINPLFKKGRDHTLVMALIYVAARFSDPIITPIISGIPLELEFNLIFGLLVAAAIGYSAMLGSVKLAGFLCLLAPVGNMGMMISAAETYSGGFTEMMRRAPTAWYILAVSIICGAVGIVLLVDKSAAAFGKRRKEIQKEYVAALKAYSNAPKNREGGVSDHQAMNQPKEQVESQAPMQKMPPREDMDTNAETRQTESEPPMAAQPREEASTEIAAETKAEPRQQAIAEYMAEFEGVSSTLRAFSTPSPVSQVSKQRFFNLYREMVCKKFGCGEEEVDSATYILIFPGNKLALMKWLPEEKKIYFESNTKRYDTQFHTLMLHVIDYLSKSIGAKFDITDLSKEG